MHGYSLSYRHVMMSQLKRIAEIVGVPIAEIRRMPKIPCAEPREMTVPEAEFERMLKTSPPHLGLILLLAHEAGLRTMTATKLTKANCNFDERRIVGTTKGGSKYDVPMTKRLYERLLWYCAAAEDANEPLTAIYRMPRQIPTEKSIRSAMREARKRIGVVATWGIHDLRRTAARKLYLQTGDIRKVQAFLGHKMLWTTCWYLGNAVQSLNQADLEASSRYNWQEEGREIA